MEPTLPGFFSCAKFWKQFTMVKLGLVSFVYNQFQWFTISLNGLQSVSMVYSLNGLQSVSMVYSQSQWFTISLNGLQSVSMVYSQSQWFTVSMVYNQSQWFTVSLNGLQSVSMVYNQSQWFTVSLNGLQSVSMVDSLVTFSETCLTDEEIQSISIIPREIICIHQFPAIHTGTLPHASFCISKASDTRPDSKWRPLRACPLLRAMPSTMPRSNIIWRGVMFYFQQMFQFYLSGITSVKSHFFLCILDFIFLCLQFLFYLSV